MVDDLYDFRKRKDVIKKMCGIKSYRDNGYTKITDIYSIYYNPSTWLINGFRDNEREKFYHYHNEKDMIEFIHMINLREFRLTESMQNIEQIFRSCTDNEIRYHEIIHKLEEKVDILTKENEKLKFKLKNNNVLMR